jgi:hypothetical protein
MNPADERFDAPPDPVLDDLREGMHSQRTLLCVTLVSLILLGLAVDRFLLKQVTMVRQQIVTAQTMEKQLEGRFDFNRATAFWNNLITYSKTHPDFVPVVTKFGQVINQTMLNAPLPQTQ